MTETWTTGAGEKIPICEMADSHLINTIKLLQKRAFQRRSARIVRAVQRPYKEDEIKELVGLSFINFTPRVYAGMTTEANERGLYFPKEPETPTPPYMMPVDTSVHWETEEDYDV